MIRSLKDWFYEKKEERHLRRAEIRRVKHNKEVELFWQPEREDGDSKEIYTMKRCAKCMVGSDNTLQSFCPILEEPIIQVGVCPIAIHAAESKFWA